MKRIFSILFALALVLGVSLVAGPAAEAAPAQTVLWGVTGVNFGAVNEYSQVFKVDTATGTVTIVGAAAHLFSDIAATPNGNLYAVGRSTNDNIACPGGGASANFNDFYRLDPCTAAIVTAWDDVFTTAGFRHVNALSAENNTSLLAIEGGGICAGWSCTNAPQLLRITLDAGGNYVSITNLGTIAAAGANSMCCDGDLDQDPGTGKWYAGFWAPTGSEMVEVNLANPGLSTLRGQSLVSWQGGFAFLSSGTAYAGSWADKKLYTVNVLGGGNSVAWDLSGSLAGCIFGLSRSYPTVSTPTTTGTGTASFSGSQGCITDLTAVATPPAPPVVLPHGMFSFKVLCISPGATVTLTVTLPGPVPAGTRWWKYQGGSWYSLPIGGGGTSVITVTLKDWTPTQNGVGDEDSTGGLILDPGGPGPGPVGWETYPISKVRVLLPWIALFAFIAAGVSLLVLRRRRVQS
jgi:hypothetical protein